MASSSSKVQCFSFCPMGEKNKNLFFLIDHMALSFKHKHNIYPYSRPALLLLLRTYYCQQKEVHAHYLFVYRKQPYAIHFSILIREAFPTTEASLKITTILHLAFSSAKDSIITHSGLKKNIENVQGEITLWQTFFQNAFIRRQI